MSKSHFLPQVQGKPRNVLDLSTKVLVGTNPLLPTVLKGVKYNLKRAHKNIKHTFKRKGGKKSRKTRRVTCRA